MMKKVLKKIFLYLGYEISKIYKQEPKKDSFNLNEKVTPLEWLKEYQIASIIDIGANEGQFVEKIEVIFPLADIYCFEPIMTVFDLLCAKFKGKSNITFFNYGLGDEDEKKHINQNEYSPSSSLLEMLDIHKSNFDFAIKTEPTAISIRRLDGVFSRPPKKPVLLKVDVQGYEMSVLKGGDSIVGQSDVIIIETTFVPLYKDQPLFGEIYSHLTARGFRYVGNIEQLISPKNNQILQADAVFVK